MAAGVTTICLQVVDDVISKRGISRFYRRRYMLNDLQGVSPRSESFPRPRVSGFSCFDLILLSQILY